MKTVFKNLLLGLSLLLMFSACSKDTFNIQVTNLGENNCLASTSVKALGLTADSPVTLFIVTDGVEELVPCQLAEDETGDIKLYWMLPEGIADASFVLKKGSIGCYTDRVSLTDNGSQMAIRKGEKSILQYYHKPAPLPEGVSESYSRSGFIHPAWSPAGNVLTNIQPIDHRHHYGIWNPWTRVVYDGDTYDLWNIGDGQGTVQFSEMVDVTEGPVWGGFKVKHDHIIYREGQPSVIMEEYWNIKAWTTNNAGQECFVWDFVSELNPSTALPVLLQAYRYAGFGYRATDVWTKENCVMYSSKGKGRREIDGTDARWIYVTGEINGGKSGLLMMSHKKNRMYPEPLRIWDENANNGRGDAFINFAPTKNEDWQLEPGKSYELKYRVVTYDGEMHPEKAERMWNEFANPPVVVVK